MFDRFLAGYRAFGGRPEWEDDFHAIIYGPTLACPNGESGGDPYAQSPFGHKGLAQFDDQTWAGAAAQTGLWDVWDPFAQGANSAVVSNDPRVGLTAWSCRP